MTNIEWGAEIVLINNERPEWLPSDSTPIAYCESDGKWWGNGIDGFNWFAREINELGSMDRIRLPATHPYYLATLRGFTYWPGGESAPDDWDGSRPLAIDDGEVRELSSDCFSGCWQRGNAWVDIIGYRKRTEQPAPAIAPELVEECVEYVRRMAGLGYEIAGAIMAKIEPDPDLTLAKSIVGDAEAIALAIKAARENGRG